MHSKPTTGDSSRNYTLELTRAYLRLIFNAEYSQFLDDLLSTNTLLMVGYGLRDLDLLWAMDRASQRKRSALHYILCKRSSRNGVERRRLLNDRNVHVIEYVDHFGFHNHVETFLEAMLEKLGLQSQLTRVRVPIRCRMRVHYPNHLASDGRFVWHYVFREGAITMSKAIQDDQLNSLRESLSDRLRATDYVVLVLDSAALESEFRQIVEETRNTASMSSVQVIFLVVGESERPEYLRRVAPAHPTFLLRRGFGERDLSIFRDYVSQDLKMGLRQIDQAERPR